MELWHNPANYQSGGATHTLPFTAAPTATSVQFQVQVSTTVGPFAVSDVSLEGEIPSYTIARKTYFLGSQAIATRISGDLDGNNSLFYIHTDHLGSTSLMSDADGQKVETSVARYLPYGGWRTEPTADLTDRAYTGQKENMDIGLYYYNARYYLPYINRFISADTIVPNPANPQNLNRYSYGLNNPLRYTDPTGHFSEDAIYNYILNHECGGSFICADDTIEAWSQNQAWWLVLLIAGANDVLYGMDGGGPGRFAFTGSGQGLLTGIVTDFGVGIRLSSFLNGSYTIPHVIDSSGRLASGIPSATRTLDWEALWFHDTGNVTFRGDFAATANAMAQILGSQYIPPTFGSALRSARIARGQSFIGSGISMILCGPVGPLCEAGFAGIIAGSGEAFRRVPGEQLDLVRQTTHWQFYFRVNPLTITFSRPTTNQAVQGSFEYFPPIITPRY